ncbi:integrase [Acidithiobacillus ferrivorans]|uniref:integrase n=1 Tax=Acidithiobacillus ferrivorans TaxID=160808 RepID=UPI001D00B9DE|nr:site-specific integrase [Acidithiobacillus ferrivorans]MBU2851473.1 site-specific integrase [Acidithiobacillus ferrivorans]
MATIRARVNRWQARVRHGGFTVEKTFTYKKEAERWARDTESAIDRGEYEKPKEQAARAVTIGDLLTRYLGEVADQHRSKTTGWNVQTLLRGLAAVPVAGLDAQTLAQWRDERLKEVSGASVVRELRTLSAVLVHARKEWCISVTNPCADIRQPAQGAKRERRLAPGEESRLLAELAPQYRPVVRFALETAMRRGEVLALRWEHVDLTKRVALLPITKNGEARRVPLSTGATALLREAGQVRALDGRVFPIPAQSLAHAWSAACARAGIDDLHFHDLRHEAVSRLFERGLSMMEVASISGHKTLSMLQRYTHLRAEDLAAKMG